MGSLKTINVMQKGRKSSDTFLSVGDKRLALINSTTGSELCHSSKGKILGCVNGHLDETSGFIEIIPTSLLFWHISTANS